ncbi:solute carrier organic anion transporter family member 4A1 [Octopus bimaculoides]|uniref:solute carrier organic anion transporter family member 4A1 n=1 Tax=Octopus bimaculoides TaxID=37653 RepID=UPI0022E3C079|nr:solute carrier organic anion transporter family member 4A1 [Octopus bimaculoides]
MCEFRPKWMQIFNNPRALLFFLCAGSFIQGFVLNGLNSVNATSLERRFGLSSSNIGMIASVYDISAAIFGVLISYLCSRGHKPRCLGISILVMGLGSLVMALPHFTTDRYKMGSENVLDQSVCLTGNNTHCRANTNGSRLSWYLYIFLIGQILNGVGGATLYTVGFACIDDNVSHKRSPVYISILLCLTMVGVAVGYTAGGKLLDYHVDFLFIDSNRINTDPKNPRWVGAWWVGYLGGGLIAIIMGPFLLFYPKKLPGKRSLIFRKNKRRSMFNYSSDPSNAIFFHLGMVVVPAGAAGQLLGGYLSRRLQLHVKGMARMCIITLTLSSVGIAAFWARCDSVPVAGISASYNANKQPYDIVNLTSKCNELCHCTTEIYEPVCSPDGLQYFSPCHAGCTKISANGDFYMNCMCVENAVNFQQKPTVEPQTVSRNTCVHDCTQIYFFLPAVFLNVFFSFIAQTPLVSMVLRCTDQDQRAFALGLNAFLVRMLGSLPGPLLIGTIIDRACSVWQSTCEGDSSCWIYNDIGLAANLIVLVLTLRLVSIVSLFLADRFYKPLTSSAPTEAPTRTTTTTTTAALAVTGGAGSGPGVVSGARTGRGGSGLEGNNTNTYSPPQPSPPNKDAVGVGGDHHQRNSDVYSENLVIPKRYSVHILENDIQNYNPVDV